MDTACKYGNPLHPVKLLDSIPGVPEKAERWNFSTLRAENVAYVYVIR